jgi:predicted ester cyclase
MRRSAKTETPGRREEVQVMFGAHTGRRYALRAILGLVFTAVTGSFKALFAATNQPTPVPPVPPVPPNQAVVRDFIQEVWNEGNFVELKKYFSVGDKVRPCGGLAKEQVIGRPGGSYEAQVRAYRKAFPDLRVQILSMTDQGGTVNVKWAAQGTHRGDLPMIRATGRHAAWAGTAWFRVRGDKISASDAQYDAGQLMQQLKTH